MTDIEQMILTARNKRIDSDREFLDLHMNCIRHNAELIVRAKRALPNHAQISGDCFDLDYAVFQGMGFRVEEDDLPALRREFGMCRDEGNYKVDDHRRNIVRVVLNLGFEMGHLMQHYTCYLYYLKTLPEDARCKIHSEVNLNYSVVCGVG